MCSDGGTDGMTQYKLQYNVCIDTWSLRHLTSAEEYPDEEYLDMSKSSSLKSIRYKQLKNGVQTVVICMMPKASEGKYGICNELT